jgi:hypothetical protein
MRCQKCGRDNYDWVTKCGRCGHPSGAPPVPAGSTSDRDTLAPILSERRPLMPENPVCPNCRNIYNRVAVIRELKKQSPWLFDAAVWTTKFKCVECGTVIVISGTRGE